MHCLAARHPAPNLLSKSIACPASPGFVHHSAFRGKLACHAISLSFPYLDSRRLIVIDQPTTKPSQEPILRIVPMPREENMFGDIFGGWVMSQVDIAGGVVAMRRMRGRASTVAVNAFEFHQPISAGDLVSFYADIVKVGKTSVQVHVSVYAERHPETPVCVKVTEATLTYVAVDRDGRKRDVPPENS
jgi:acyl-CoA thioesterase YciA